MHPSQWRTGKCGWKCGSLDSSDRQREKQNDNHKKQMRWCGIDRAPRRSPDADLTDDGLLMEVRGAKPPLWEGGGRCISRRRSKHHALRALAIPPPSQSGGSTPRALQSAAPETSATFPHTLSAETSPRFAALSRRKINPRRSSCPDRSSGFSSYLH